MKRKLSALPSVFFLLILSIFFYLLMIERNPNEIPSNLLNNKAPSFKAMSLFKNEKFISSEEFGKEITLVNFFATWCKPCKEEHVYIKRFAKEKKIRIIGINYKDSSEKTLDWLNNLGNPYSNVPIDRNGRIAIDWGVYGIPETFIVDSNGIIKYRHVGQITKQSYKKINFIIDELENEK